LNYLAIGGVRASRTLNGVTRVGLANRLA